MCRGDQDILGTNKSVECEDKRMRPKESEVFRLFGCSKKLRLQLAGERSMQANGCRGLTTMIEWCKDTKEFDGQSLPIWCKNFYDKINIDNIEIGPTKNNDHCNRQTAVN